MLVSRPFGLFLVGKLASTTAIWIANITSALYVYSITRSAFQVGLVSILQFLPQIVLAPLTGVLADRADRRIVLILARLSSVLVALALAAWLAMSDGGDVRPIQIASLLLGVGLAVASPSINALVPSLVDRRDLVTAISLNTASVNIARAIGPALGGYLYYHFGPGVAYATCALGHLMFVAFLFAIRHPSREAGSGDRSVAGAVRFLRDRPSISLLLVSVATIGFVVDVPITLATSVADELDRGAQFVGLLGSAFGAGAISILVLSSRIDRWLGVRGSGQLGFGLLMAGMVLLASSHHTRTALAAMLVAGMGFLLATAAATSRIQLAVPDSFRGRIMAVWGIGFLGVRPLAAAVHGLVAERVSVPAAVLVSAVVAMVGGILTRVAHEERTGDAGPRFRPKR